MNYPNNFLKLWQNITSSLRGCGVSLLLTKYAAPYPILIKLGKTKTILYVHVIIHSESVFHLTVILIIFLLRTFSAIFMKMYEK